MLIEHLGKRPRIDPSAYVAPTATLCGDVTVGPDCRVLFGAVVTADGGPVEIGERCIVMENTVIRGTARHPVRTGDHVLVGPRAYLTGCAVEDDAFLATGSTVFNAARIGARAEVRINGVVHPPLQRPGGARPRARPRPARHAPRRDGGALPGSKGGGVVAQESAIA